MKRKLICLSLILCFIILFVGILIYRQKIELNEIEKYFDISQHGLSGYYYNNEDFSGSPISQLIDISIDEIDFYKVIGKRESFSAKWQGIFYSPKKTKYKYYLNSDDGSFLFIDNILVIDNWGVHPAELKKKTITVDKGWHSIEILYFQHTSGYDLSFQWKDLRGKMGEQTNLSIFHPSSSDEKFKQFQKKYIENVKINKIILSVFLYIGSSFFLVGLIAFLSYFIKCIKKGLTSEPHIDLSWFRNNWLSISFIIIILIFAFMNRLSYYLKNPYICSQGLCTGSVYQTYFFKSIFFAGTIKLSSLNINSEGLIVPFLGLLFKLFGIYPGIWYFSVIEIVISSFICVVPFFIAKPIIKRFSIGGILIGLWLAFIPLDIEVSAQIANYILELFILSGSLLFFYRSWYCRKRYGYILFGVFSILAINTRHPLDKIGVLMILSFLIINMAYIIKKLKSYIDSIKLKLRDVPKIKIILSLLILTLAIYGYDNLYKKGRTVSSLINCIKNQDQFVKNVKGFILEVPKLIENTYNNFKRLNEFFFVSILYSKVYLAKIVLILSGFFILLAIIYKKYIHFVPIPVFGLSYYFILGFMDIDIHSLLPIILFIGVGLVFLIEFIISITFFAVEKYAVKIAKIFLLILTFAILIFLFFSGKIFYTSVRDYRNYIDYLKWVGSEIPKDSVILTEEKANPWLISKYADKPVIHNIICEESIFVEKIPCRLGDFKTTKTISEDEDITNTGKVLNSLYKKGSTFVLLDTEFIDTLRVNYLRGKSTYPIDNDYKIVLFKKMTAGHKDKSVYFLTKK